MSDFVDPDEGRLEDDLAKVDLPEEAPQSIKAPAADACFPSDSQGMPKALKAIPARERTWFWKNMRYRNHFIAHVPVQDPLHKYLFEQKTDRAFYVSSPEGTIGLVPFPNSTVVWPWEAAWKQDLAPENQGKTRRDLKPSERK